MKFHGKIFKPDHKTFLVKSLKILSKNIRILKSK